MNFEVIEQATGIKREELISQNRKSELCDVRHLHWYHLCRKISKSQIARMYQRKHSTIRHGIQRVDNMIFTDMKLRNLNSQLLALSATAN